MLANYAFDHTIPYNKYIFLVLPVPLLVHLPLYYQVGLYLQPFLLLLLILVHQDHLLGHHCQSDLHIHTLILFLLTNQVTWSSWDTTLARCSTQAWYSSFSSGTRYYWNTSTINGRFNLSIDSTVNVML